MSYSPHLVVCAPAIFIVMIVIAVINTVHIIQLIVQECFCLQAVAPLSERSVCMKSVIRKVYSMIVFEVAQSFLGALKLILEVERLNQLLLIVVEDTFARL